MVPSLDLSTVVCRDLLLWNCLKNSVKWRQRGPPFHTFLQIFYKNVKILVLSYNLSHVVANFQKDWQKTCPYISLLCLCNNELHKKFGPILIACQRWSHSEKRKTSITFDLDMILTCGVFLKVTFCKGVSVKNYQFKQWI